MSQHSRTKFTSVIKHIHVQRDHVQRETQRMFRHFETYHKSTAHKLHLPSHCRQCLLFHPYLPHTETDFRLSSQRQSVITNITLASLIPVNKLPHHRKSLHHSKATATSQPAVTALYYIYWTKIPTTLASIYILWCIVSFPILPHTWHVFSAHDVHTPHVFLCCRSNNRS